MIEESAVLRADARAVQSARRLTARLCDSAGAPDDMRDTAVLLTSEVVTNAITHGRSEARLRVLAGPARVRVEVGDDNSRPPTVQRQDEEALDGRGMALLDRLSYAWGSQPAGVGKVVWFELRL